MDKRRVNVRAIIFKDGKLLVQKFRTKDGGESDYWGTPGGGLDPHESLADGLVREIEEEMGVKAQVGRLLFIQQFRSIRTGHDEELELFFHIENPEDFEKIDLETTTHGLTELTRCEFVDPKKAFILPEFLQTVDIADYVSTVRPVLITNMLKN